jgi:hypothetical protein
MTAFSCCDQNRRRLVRASAALNGIDYLEVVDLDAATPALRQRQLRLNFLKAPAPAGIGPANVVIEGGERITGVRADSVAYDGDVVVVHLTAYGDFSPYILKLVAADGRPFDGLDPLLAEIRFWFKAECPSDLDCQVDQICPAPPARRPQIDYLAKDYESFRRLMLDRMALTAPNWSERNPADVGVALVETLAYVADHLSYRQDAIATEAYLGTARSRISLRRHARLVDYAMHDGCNARVFVALRVKSGANGKTLPGPNPGLTPPVSGALLLTRVQKETWISAAFRDRALSAAPVCFETMHDLTLFESLNELKFYTFGDARCCLPKGSTQATLAGPLPALEPGRLLIFQERLSPTTGRPADADLSHRHPVRLTRVAPGKDALTNQEIVDIGWDRADALPFPLCVSAVANDGRVLVDVSVALGNVVLADHGLTQPLEEIGAMPESGLAHAGGGQSQHCSPAPLAPVPARFRPQLAKGPVTQTGHSVRTMLIDGQPQHEAIAFDPQGSAASALQWAISDCLPAIRLTSKGADTLPWEPRRDLLESNPTSAHFVAETDFDAIARIRFGDDEYGVRPAAGDAFTAIYRVGNGVAGNVGAGGVAHVVEPPAGTTIHPDDIDSVTNPLAARGGQDPETADSVRMAAPAAFRIQERAVTAADYEAVSLRNDAIAEAAATFRWTGSWHTVFDTVERADGQAVDAPFRQSMRDYLERFRVIGHDLEVDGPIYASLRIDMSICVRPPWFRADVTSELRALLGTGVLSDGRLGFFNRANLSFGQTLYLSPIYALVQSVAGVDSVEVTRFERLYQPSKEGLTTWELRFGRLEIPRCDNDPDYPEHGVINLVVRGGQ